MFIKEFFSDTIATVREINRKYQKPSVEMSKAVRYSLLFLRFYLIFLVCLLIYKFITLL